MSAYKCMFINNHLSDEAYIIKHLLGGSIQSALINSTRGNLLFAICNKTVTKQEETKISV